MGELRVNSIPYSSHLLSCHVVEGRGLLLFYPIGETLTVGMGGGVGGPWKR